MLSDIMYSGKYVSLDSFRDLNTCVTRFVRWYETRLLTFVRVYLNLQLANQIASEATRVKRVFFMILAKVSKPINNVHLR